MIRQLAALACASTLLLSSAGCSAPAKSGCESDVQCREGRICDDGVCRSADGSNNGSTNNANNGTTANNGTVGNNGSNNQNNENNVTTGNNENNREGSIERVCEDFCDRLFGSCVQQSCDVGPAEQGLLESLTEQCLFVGFEGDPGCIEALQAEPDAVAEVEQFLATTQCDSPELEEFRCVELIFRDQCGCDPVRFTNVGNPCQEDFECDGELPGFCVQEVDGVQYPDGYCVSFGCPAGPEPTPEPICGDGNYCIENPEVGGICIDGCDESSDCRDGYQCRLAGALGLEPIRICTPACDVDSDCNDGERCADGTCQIPCSEGSPNEPGGREICDALGFECFPDDAGVEWCVMP